MTKKVGLSEFIKEKYPLIATIGVFGAVTALFLRLEGIEDIAFITLMIFLVLMWELLDSFPEIGVPLKSSIRLVIFQFLIIVFLMAVGWYIIVTYIVIFYRAFAFALLLGLYTAVFMIGIHKVRLSERIQQKVKGKLYSLIENLILIVAILVIMILASYSADFIIALVERFL